MHVRASFQLNFPCVDCVEDAGNGLERERDERDSQVLLVSMRDDTLTIKLKTKRLATINDTSMIDRYLQSRAIAALVRWFGQEPDRDVYIAPCMK